MVIAAPDRDEQETNGNYDDSQSPPHKMLASHERIVPHGVREIGTYSATASVVVTGPVLALGRAQTPGLAMQIDPSPPPTSVAADVDPMSDARRS